MRIYDKKHPLNAIFCEQLQSIIEGKPKTVQRRKSGEWIELRMIMIGIPDCWWEDNWEYRIKPPEPVIITRTVTYPAPMTVALAIGTEYFVCLPDGTIKVMWTGVYIDEKWLVAGVCHLTLEAAQQQWDALFGAQK